MYPHAWNRNSTNICFLTTNILNLKLNFTTSWVLDQNLAMIAPFPAQFFAISVIGILNSILQGAGLCEIPPTVSPLKAKL